MFRGHNKIVYGGLREWNLQNMSVMSLDFAEIKISKNMSYRDDIQDALSPSTAIF